MDPSLRLTEALASLPYPISKSAALDKVGRLPLPNQDADIQVSVGNILQGVRTSTFLDAQHAEQAIFERWERFSRSLGAIEAAKRRL